MINLRVFGAEDAAAVLGYARTLPGKWIQTVPASRRLLFGAQVVAARDVRALLPVGNSVGMQSRGPGQVGSGPAEQGTGADLTASYDHESLFVRPFEGERRSPELSPVYKTRHSDTPAKHLILHSGATAESVGMAVVSLGVGSDFQSDVLRAGLHSDSHAKPLILYSDLVACGVRMDTDFARLSSAS